MATVPPQSVIDARFRAKLDARATGATPVMVEAPPDDSPENLDAKVREKLARHRLQEKHATGKPAPAPVAEAKPAPAVEPEKPAQGHQGGDQRHHDKRR